MEHVCLPKECSSCLVFGHVFEGCLFATTLSGQRLLSRDTGVREARVAIRSSPVDVGWSLWLSSVQIDLRQINRMRWGGLEQSAMRGQCATLAVTSVPMRVVIVE